MRSPEDAATERKGEPRGGQKLKRRKVRRAAPPRTDQRDGEEKENGWTITKRRPMNRKEMAEHHRRVRRTLPTKIQESLRPDRNSDKAAKHETPQGDERTGNHGW